MSENQMNAVIVCLDTFAMCFYGIGRGGVTHLKAKRIQCAG